MLRYFKVFLHKTSKQQLAVAQWSWRRGGNISGGSRQPYPRVAKKIQQKYSQPYSAPLMSDIARHTLKDFSKKSLRSKFIRKLQ